jgi:hypothetical protein
MAKKKVFVSFDYDNDKPLKEFIIGQAKLADSPFEVIDFSLKEAGPYRDARLQDPECPWRAQGGQDRERAEEGEVPDHRLQRRFRDLGGSKWRPSLPVGLGQPEETPQVMA